MFELKGHIDREKAIEIVKCGDAVYHHTVGGAKVYLLYEDCWQFSYLNHENKADYLLLDNIETAIDCLISAKSFRHRWFRLVDEWITEEEAIDCLLRKKMVYSPDRQFLCYLDVWDKNKAFSVYMSKCYDPYSRHLTPAAALNELHQLNNSNIF